MMPAVSRVLAAPPAAEGMSGLVLWGAGAFLVLLGLGSLYDPRVLMLGMLLAVLLALGIVVVRAPVGVCVAWLVLAGTSPEYWLGEMLPGNEAAITAAVKMLGLVLVGVCMLRYGACFDAFNPAIAFVAMFLIGLMHGLYPGATTMDSVRSLIGAAAPFAFSFSRLSRRWCRAMIEATIWTPACIVAFGVLLAGAGQRPLFTALENRLEASTHPAFLGGFAMAAICAAVLELYRDGRSIRIVAIAVNLLILLLSGARAPLAVALAVTGSAFFLLRSDIFPARRRVPFVLAGLLMLPVLVGVATGATSLRLLNVLSSEASDLSGRDIIWPFFQDAWKASPVFGWGVGASKQIIDPDSLTAKLLGTTAAHNEYLRIGVDGGYVGLALLIAMMALWCWRWTRGMRTTDRFIMRAVFICFAVHSITDNTLIAATASVLFTWVSVVFARGALERRAASAVVARQTEAAQIA